MSESTPLNGSAACDAPSLPTLQEAQAQLVAAALRQGIEPAGLAQSAYVNGLLQSARVTALMRLIQQLHPAIDVEATLTVLATEAMVRDILPRLKAAEAPAIVRAGHRVQ